MHVINFLRLIALLLNKEKASGKYVKLFYG
jgi:hypothetical protein